MNLSQRQIRAFLAIARLQSFTRAAEQLHITQAGLSSMLRDVEAQLDCRLFDRTTRAVSLTPAGRAFVPVATRVLAELDGAAAALGRLSESRQQTLSVGATPLVASCLLPAACEAFARTHPGVMVEVHDLDRAQIQDRVQEAQIDVGYGVFLQAASGIRRQPLLKTDLVLVSRKATRVTKTAKATRTPKAAASRTPRGVAWRDLDGVALVCLPIDNPIQQLVDSHLTAIGRGNEPRRAFNHLHTVLAMVEAGAGSAILPSFVAAAASRYALNLVPLADPLVSLEFFEITKKGGEVMPATQAFSQCVVAAMAQRA
ncbi:MULTISPECIES: LysR family transcriptional regulator [unclassified Variovorax]|uniref:LysR family transcriptional regulator n=1 Tax=unclassified Variovorax TaxID=663243 RepID=UPI0008BC84B7|nr:MULTISPECIES: LysR family transcriptional regulator [unclassified Variovorax]SEK16299.1 DNA-binding transcriptional regulator, LysR family [Variovorax sp. OK202]SFE40244.1 DNA-binding transcriptional regulator, LysR family [Variovorax sp. OK212]